MADVTIWDILTAAGATGSVGILGLLAFRAWNGIPNIMEKWLAFRIARAEEKAADWSRLRDLLKDQGDEIGRLSKAEKQCREDYTTLHSQHMELHNEHAELSRRVAELEGYQIGKGQVRQELTIFEATKRVKKDVEE